MGNFKVQSQWSSQAASYLSAATSLSITATYHTAPELKAALGSDLDEFRPERWIAGDGSLVTVPALDSLAFGHGQRICLGMRLAEFEGLLVLARVLQRFVIQQWEGPPLDEKTGFTTEPAEDVRIALQLREERSL